MPQPVSEGNYRVGAQYGEVLRDGQVLAEVTSIEATIEIAVIDVPLVGRTSTGYKTGRESREGTFAIQKIDSFWEREIYAFMSQSLEERRQARRDGEPRMRPFQLQIQLDDPDALGYEVWQLNGCMIFRLPLGHDITDELITREIPFRFESEQPLADFVRTGAVDPATGLPSVSQTDIRTG